MNILIIVYNKIENDARVIRSAEALATIANVTLVSFGSDCSYKNKHFKSIVFTSGSISQLNLLNFWIKVLRYFIRTRSKYDFIYLNDYYLPIIGWIAHWGLSKKWIYDAHELLIWNKDTRPTFRKRFFYYLERISIKSASLVITTNYERMRIMQYVYRLKNVIYVLNTSNKNTEDISKKATKMIIGYQGYMSESRNVSKLIDMLLYLPRNVKLKLIGDGPDLNLYKSLVNEKNLQDRVIFTGLVPYSELFEESKECVVGIVMYKLEGLNNYYCSPNKIYEYAHLKIPMILSSQPFLKFINEKYQIGEVVNPDDTIRDMANKAFKIMNNIEHYQINMKQFLNDFSNENEMEKLKCNVKEIAFIERK